MKGIDLLVALVSIVGFLIVVLGGIGAVAAYRVSKNTGVVRNYKEAAESWKVKSESQEAEISELREQMAERDRQISDLRGQLTALQNVVSGREAVQELGLKLDRTLDTLSQRVAEMSVTVASLNETARRDLS